MRNNGIDITSLILQLYNLLLLLQDYNNTDLMGELQKQDKQYLEKIIKQNDEILKILKRKEEFMKEDISKELLKKTQEKIKEILDSDITPNNLENLDKLVDIFKDTKEVENMNYGNYGNYGRGSYGEYGRRAGYDSYGDSYGRRGYDTKYRGYDKINEMGNEYGRYMESRERYGASEETNKSFHYMVKALEDFVKVLHEEAETPQEKQMLRESLQNSMM